MILRDVDKECDAMSSFGWKILLIDWIHFALNEDIKSNLNWLMKEEAKKSIAQQQRQQEKQKQVNYILYRNNNSVNVNFYVI